MVQTLDKEAQKEFLKLDNQAQKLIASKIIDLQNGNFSNDKIFKENTKVSLEKERVITE